MDDKAPEQIERICHAVAQHDKAWDDRFTFLRPKLIERYYKGEICFHVCFRIEFSELNCEDFCAVFCGPEAVGFGRRGHPNHLGGITLSAVYVEGVAKQDRVAHDQQESVLVGVAEAIENGQGVKSRFNFPVRLNRINEGAGAPGDALYFSPLTGFFKFLRGVADWEMQLGRRIGVPFDGQRPNQVIEAASKMVDDFSGQDREPEWDRPIAECGKRVCSLLVIELTDDSIRLRLRAAPSLDFKFQVLDILVGPFNLRPTTV